jgi:hypothetical protein
LLILQHALERTITGLVDKHFVFSGNGDQAIPESQEAFLNELRNSALIFKYSRGSREQFEPLELNAGQDLLRDQIESARGDL